MRPDTGDKAGRQESGAAASSWNALICTSQAIFASGDWHLASRSTSRGTALSVIDPQPNGYPRSITDPLGRHTTFEYNGSGIDPIRIRQGGDTILRASYTSTHRPTSITGPDGRTTSFTWANSRADLDVMTRPGGIKFNQNFDTQKRIKKISPPLDMLRAAIIAGRNTKVAKDFLNVAEVGLALQEMGWA